MRISREALIKIAEDTSGERTQADEGIVSAYIHGSLMDLEEEPIIGGTVDIDVVFIHEGEIGRREIVRLTDEVHLDIEYHPQSRYEQARELRVDTWLGPAIYACQNLYDPKHFLDFTQAGVRGMYARPEHVLGRVESQLDKARRLWFKFNNRSTDPDPAQILAYLRALSYVGNAVACLEGPPLTDRRFLVNYKKRTASLGDEGLYAGLVGLLGGTGLDNELIKVWMPAWEAAFESASAIPEHAVNLHAHRQMYYQRAIETLLGSEQPEAALWPMLRTWAEAANMLPKQAAPIPAWRDSMRKLNLLGEAFFDRVAGLDVYLDRVEDMIEGWKEKRGL